MSCVRLLANANQAWLIVRHIYLWESMPETRAAWDEDTEEDTEN